MPRAGHAIGDDRRQQRFDGAKERDRESRTDELEHIGDRQLGPLQRG
ncbi:MAG: hypothetical protein WDZ66_09245 [Steroidobacteraceae bacterium]